MDVWENVCQINIPACCARSWVILVSPVLSMVVEILFGHAPEVYFCGNKSCSDKALVPIYVEIVIGFIALVTFQFKRAQIHSDARV